MAATALAARLAGRFAREALAHGDGEVCALARGSFYLRLPGERYARIGGEPLGGGPLHAIVEDFRPAGLGQAIRVDLENAASWAPPALALGSIDFRTAAQAAPAQGFARLIGGSHDALSVHAQPALEALDRWLVGHALGGEAQALIGLGGGLRPPGDDYLGGVLVALRLAGRGVQADSLWRWLEPRLAARTPGVSAAHLAAAAAGEAEEALHLVLGGEPAFGRLEASGWNSLAGAAAVLKAY
jgi:hypothetical protein